jgi:hypothetical protein
VRPERAEVGGAGVLAHGRAGAPQLAVQMHGQAESPQLVGQHERERDRRAPLLRLRVDDRRHVERADPRVHALVAGQVHPRERLARAREKRVEIRSHGEHGAVVVGIRVDVQDPGPERGADPGDGLGVAPLGDVGYREQRHA